MIAKQFLITGMIWAIIGGLMSVLFRLQLGYPDQTFHFWKIFSVRWAKGGKITAESYYALVTMHGTVLVFFVLTGGLSGTFANFLIPLQIGARDMASPFLNMLSYWFFFMASVVMLSSLFVQTGPFSGGWTAYPPLSALGGCFTGFKNGYGSMDNEYGTLRGFFFAGRFELYFYGIEHAYQRNEHDEVATDHLGPVLYCGTWSIVIPCIIIRFHPVIVRPSWRYQLLSFRYLYSSTQRRIAK